MYQDIHKGFVKSLNLHQIDLNSYWMQNPWTCFSRKMHNNSGSIILIYAQCIIINYIILYVQYYYIFTLRCSTLFYCCQYNYYVLNLRSYTCIVVYALSSEHLKMSCIISASCSLGIFHCSYYSIITVEQNHPVLGCMHINVII